MWRRWRILFTVLRGRCFLESAYVTRRCMVAHCFNVKFYLLLFLINTISEQKLQKFSEIKAGLDDADVLVLRWMFSYVFVLLSLLVLSSIHFYITYLPLQIRKMDLEARSLQPSVKAMLLAKLREYKSDLSNLKKEFKRLTSPNSDEAAREELLETGMADTHLVYLGP